MRRALFAGMANAAVVAVLSWTGAAAQQPDPAAPPLYRNTYTHIGGVSIPAVPGNSFTATAVIKNQKALPNGATETLHTFNLVGRDSQGRTRGEQRSMVNGSFEGMPELVEVHLYDPQTGVHLYIDTRTSTARRVVTEPARDEGGGEAAAKNPAVKPQVAVEDLGSATLEGIEVHGTRRTLTIPAAANGTGEPLLVFDEYWYSEELQLNLLVVHSDPRTGTQTIAITNVKREEPPAMFFELPPGVRIVEESRRRAPKGPVQ